MLFVVFVIRTLFVLGNTNFIKGFTTTKTVTVSAKGETLLTRDLKTSQNFV